MRPFVTAATGATGTFVGSFPSAAALQAAQPPGNPGEHYLVERDVYGFDAKTGGWKRIGPLGGPTGATGPTGADGTMPAITVGPTGNWLVDGADTAKPAQGADGAPGVVGAIAGPFPSQAELQAARPSGPAGVYYLVGSDLYGYDPITEAWFNIGPIYFRLLYPGIFTGNSLI